MYSTALLALLISADPGTFTVKPGFVVVRRHERPAPPPTPPVQRQFTVRPDATYHKHRCGWCGTVFGHNQGDPHVCPNCNRVIPEPWYHVD